MSPSLLSPRQSVDQKGTSSQHRTTDSTRKRTYRACDRCRLKKSKCNGTSPCSRCRSDNAICVFGKSKRLQEKIYTKGYVEMLQRQQRQLVNGLQEMHRRLVKASAWSGPHLEEANGVPLTHDILRELGILELKHNEETDVQGGDIRLLSNPETSDPGFQGRAELLSEDVEHNQGSDTHASLSPRAPFQPSQLLSLPPYVATHRCFPPDSMHLNPWIRTHEATVVTKPLDTSNFLADCQHFQVTEVVDDMDTQWDMSDPMMRDDTLFNWSYDQQMLRNDSFRVPDLLEESLGPASNFAFLFADGLCPYEMDARINASKSR